jgi:hypothetical protein
VRRFSANFAENPGLPEATARHTDNVQRITNAASPETTRHLSVQSEQALRHYGETVALPLILGNDPAQDSPETSPLGQRLPANS